MTVSEVRRRYLAFFAARGHVVIPSAPIVPGNDPTTLFTSSGMQPLLPYFLGKDHPEGKRVVNSQLSFRAGDIEEVGDNRHTTFFEMLGNWSFGDYFKDQQLPWVFEFLTSAEEGLALDPSRLYVTVFAGDTETGMAADTESILLWKDLFAKKGMVVETADIGTEEAGYERGMYAGERIFSYGAKKNWWSRAGVPSNMPSGEPGGPDSEIFYDFMPNTAFAGGHATPTAISEWGKCCHPNCDCGRFVEIGNSVFMQFLKNENGSFSDLPKRNVDFGGGLERMTFATTGVADAFLIDVFDAAKMILEQKSEEKYGQGEMVTRSFRIILDHTRAATFMLGEGVTPSNTEAGYILRRLLRRAIRETDKLGITESILPDIAECFANAYGLVYSHVLEAKLQIREEMTKEEEQFRKTLATGMKEFEKVTRDGTITAEAVFTLFTTYGFPIELTEEMANERDIEIDLPKVMELMGKHREESRAGGAQRFAGGLADHAEQTVRYHTLHHILLAALQQVLGSEVKQRGSNITSERLRIDFGWGTKMTDEQKTAVEKIVNELIRQDLPVTRTVMPKEEAEKLGAQMEFGVKYPDMVSVYSVGPAHATEELPDILNAFSLEFCGGPHVGNTQEIYDGDKAFKIQKEEAVASGVRRIKAIMT